MTETTIMILVFLGCLGLICLSVLVLDTYTTIYQEKERTKRADRFVDSVSYATRIKHIVEEELKKKDQDIYDSCFTLMAVEYDREGAYTLDQWLEHCDAVAKAAVKFNREKEEEEKHERHPE